MAGLIDLLPDSVSDEEKAEFLRRLVETKRRAHRVPTKEELARKKEALRAKNKSYDEWVEEFEKRYKVFRDKDEKKNKVGRNNEKKKKGVVDRMAKRKIRNLTRISEGEKRKLARSGIIIFERGFVNPDPSFYGGRRRSLEWNDEIARGKSGGMGRKRKKKRKKSLSNGVSN